MPVIGGDLGAMSVLAGRFTSAGAQFNSKAQGIVHGVGDALTRFTEQMRLLDQEARRLAEEIDGEMKRLSSQAASTVWTGEHRKQHDAVVASLDDDIVAIRGAIETFMAEASNVVNGALTTAMTSLQDRVAEAGGTAQTVAGSFSSSVSGQQAKFDAVMNG